MRFLRRDAMTYLAAAARKPEERFDLVVLDPPTFGAADRQRGVAAWRAVAHYPALVRAAVGVLARGGLIFAATNARELAARGALPRLITSALGSEPAWQPLPPLADRRHRAGPGGGGAVRAVAAAASTAVCSEGAQGARSACAGARHAAHSPVPNRATPSTTCSR